MYGMELTLQWTESTDEHVRSYVNGIPTANGGTHENGFRIGLNKAVRNYIDTHNLTPRGVKIHAPKISAKAWWRSSRSLSLNRSFKARPRTG